MIKPTRITTKLRKIMLKREERFTLNKNKSVGLDIYRKHSKQLKVETIPKSKIRSTGIVILNRHFTIFSQPISTKPGSTIPDSTFNGFVELDKNSLIWRGSEITPLFLSKQSMEQIVSRNITTKHSKFYNYDYLTKARELFLDEKPNLSSKNLTYFDTRIIKYNGMQYDMVFFMTPHNSYAAFYEHQYPRKDFAGKYIYRGSVRIYEDAIQKILKSRRLV